MAGKANYLVRAKNGAVFVTSTLAEAKKVEASGKMPAKRRRNPTDGDHLVRGRHWLQTADDLFFEAEGQTGKRQMASLIGAASMAAMAQQDLGDGHDETLRAAARQILRHAREEAVDLVSEKNPAKRRKNPWPDDVPPRFRSAAKHAIAVAQSSLDEATEQAVDRGVRDLELAVDKTYRANEYRGMWGVRPHGAVPFTADELTWYENTSPSISRAEIKAALRRNPAKSKKRNPTEAEHAKRGAKRYGQAGRAMQQGDYAGAAMLAFQSESDLDDAADRGGAELAHTAGLQALRVMRAVSNPAKGRKNPVGLPSGVTRTESEMVAEGVARHGYGTPAMDRWFAGHEFSKSSASAARSFARWAQELAGVPMGVWTYGRSFRAIPVSAAMAWMDFQSVSAFKRKAKNPSKRAKAQITAEFVDPRKLK